MTFTVLQLASDARFLPEPMRDEVEDAHGVTRYTENPVQTVENVKTNRRGPENQFTLDLEEYEEGLRCVASLILGEDDQAFGTISLSGPAMKFIGDSYHGRPAESAKSAANVTSLTITRTDEKYIDEDTGVDSVSCNKNALFPRLLVDLGKRLYDLYATIGVYG